MISDSLLKLSKLNSTLPLNACFSLRDTGSTFSLIKHVLSCRDFGLHLICLVHSKEVDAERKRWGMYKLGEEDDHMHISVGFTHIRAGSKYKMLEKH